MSWRVLKVKTPKEMKLRLKYVMDAHVGACWSKNPFMELNDVFPRVKCSYMGAITCGTDAAGLTSADRPMPKFVYELYEGSVGVESNFED